MSLLEARDHYKPFAYPWAYEAYRTMQSLHWLPHESPMAEDIRDWNSKLTDNEKSLLTQLFRFFTQADIDIAQGYYEKYAPRFPHPELRMMMGAFIAAEANHIDAYSTLIDTLGLPESEYKAFQEYAAMRKKHEYMFKRDTGRGISDLAVDIAVFSAFGEGMQLFSSFAILLSFQRRGLMKGMTSIIEWSLRDETLHVESMIRLFHELVKEHPRIWNDETKKRIYDTCREMVKLEDAFIDQAFSIGPVSGISPPEAKQYIRYIADRRLLQLGLKPHYRVKNNPLPWLDWIMNAPTHTNFFEQRSTEYGKGAIEGWGNAFNFLSSETPKYLIYTMPDCPHCARAKDACRAHGIIYEEKLIESSEERDRLKATKNWTTFPMVFELNAVDLTEVRFVGGASALVMEIDSIRHQSGILAHDSVSLSEERT